MVDASGKLYRRSGRYMGNTHAIGTFDECMPIDVTVTDLDSGKVDHTFVGKYFLAKLYLGPYEAERVAAAHNDRMSALVAGDVEYSGDDDTLWHLDYGIDWEKLGIEDPLVQDLILVSRLFFNWTRHF